MSSMIGLWHSLSQDPKVTQEKVKKGTARRMFGYAWPFRGWLGLFLLVVILDAGIGIINPLLFRQIIDHGILRGHAGLIIRLALLIAGLGVCDGALGLAQSYLAARIGTRIVLLLRTRLFEHIQRMPLAFFTRVQTGAVVSRLNTDVNGAQSAFTDILSNVIGNLITVALLLGAMFALSWQITLLALVLVPIFLLPTRLWGRRLQAIIRESYNLTAAMNALMVERFNVSGAQLAKLYGRASDESQGFEKQARRVADINVRQRIYGRLFFTALMLTATLSTALAYGWGGVLAVRHVLDVGTVVAMAAYLARLYGPLAGLSNIQVNIMTALVSFQRVFEVLDLEPMIRESPQARDLPAGPVRIDFTSVSFRYPAPSEISLASLEAAALPARQAEKTILEEISFSVEAGQMTALVGPSGAGKTTITQLVTRLYDVQSGAVRLNHVDVRDLRLESLMRRIGVVTQDAHLFHDTIRANLLYEIGPARCRRCRTPGSAAGGADSASHRIPAAGTGHAGGRARLSFFRRRKAAAGDRAAALKSPDVVILDEATAHLDSESEAAIQKALEVALTGRTSLVIAHRLSTILKAEQILVVREGRIVERGRHAALLAEQGLYADLYRRQFAAHEAPAAQPVLS